MGKSPYRLANPCLNKFYDYLVNERLEKQRVEKENIRLDKVNKLSRFLELFK